MFSSKGAKYLQLTLNWYRKKNHRSRILLKEESRYFLQKNPKAWQVCFTQLLVN